MDKVTVYVGPERKAFKISKSLLCDRSEFFSRAFDDRFKERTFREGLEGEMEIPEDDAEVFAMFDTWLYRNDLPNFQGERHEDPKVAADAFSRKLYKLYYFAEKTFCRGLTNVVMDKIQDVQLRYSRRPSACDLADIYNNTMEGSKLRIYGTLLILREGAASNYPEFTAKSNPKERKKLEDDVNTMRRLASEAPDFAEDFIELQRRYGAYFGKGIGRFIEPQSRRAGVGFGRCFFHVHLNNEICHLGPEILNDHFKPIWEADFRIRGGRGLDFDSISVGSESQCSRQGILKSLWGWIRRESTGRGSGITPVIF